MFELNSSLYNYVAVSKSTTLAELDEAEMKREILNFGTVDLETSKVIPNALICWYKICVTDDITLETKRDNSFMNHTAIVLEKELLQQVLDKKDVQIQIQQMRDIVRIALVDHKDYYTEPRCMSTVSDVVRFSL